jgi:hypothetical protein
METRFLPCRGCGSEGRILTSNGGPDEIDHGPCPACDGTGAEEIKVEPVTLEDMEAR